MLASLILIVTPLAGCTSGPEIEDIVDDILGCMDENAENYAENATAELLGDCIYLASMEIFITAMTEQMEIDEMLEIIPRAGFSRTIMSSEFDADMGMQMDMIIEEMVMADLATDSAYIKTGISMAPFMTSEYIQIQVGELVNVHYTVGGMMAAENAGMGSYQTRDADPNVMEDYDLTSSESITASLGELGELPSCDVSDLSSDMPADAEPAITYDDESGVQTMTLEYTNDTGHDISIVTLIDDNEDLMSYVMSTDNGSASSSCSYTVMWGDAVVIEVDDTLPRTSIPIDFHVEGMPEDNGGDDMFYCDNGNEISRDLVDDGWDDCGDGSDESDDGGDDEVVYICDDGQEIPFDWVNDGYPDCYDESDEATYGEGDGGEPNFANTLWCEPYVETSIVGDEDPSELWDETNLDMSDCDDEPSEYYTNYELDDSPVTAPYSLTIWETEDDYDEEGCGNDGGIYDSDDDTCSFVYELSRNDTHLMWIVANWSENNGDGSESTASMYCVMYGGSYDADEDICSFTPAEIVAADGVALELYWIEDDYFDLEFYQYDSTTGSGFRAGIDSEFICDNGESVDTESYDDGWEDCEDGSDEPQGEETSEFTCMDGTVIPFSWVNNWEDDCPDGSDEQWYYQDDGGDDGNGLPTPEEAMEEVDTDGDGYMGYQEFLDAWESDPSNPDWDEVSYLLDDCDYDSNDLIDMDEMQCVIDGIVPLVSDGDGDDPDPEQMMDYMDTDDDGYLSLQELIDYINNENEQDGEPPMSSEDEEGTANWFYSGDTDGDDLLSLDEFTQLLDSTGDDDDDGNDVYWQSYEGGHCEWEGDADGEENAWYCKYEEETEWNTWWYYCENHDSDWHCTDDFGQSEDYEHSADGTEWCESFDCGDDGDGGDDGAPTPEEAMEAADANEDGYVSFQEFEDFWESDPSNPELDSDSIAALWDDCDYDGNDMIDINEVQCVIDGIGAMFDPGEANPEQIFDWMDADDDGQLTASEWADFDNQTDGEEMSEEDFDGLSDIIDMFDDDDSGGLDLYEFEIFWAFCCADDDDGDDGDGEGGNDEPFRVTMMVMDQTLNAPISDFEVRFLVDCGEPDEEGNEPPISNCTVAASNGLTEGSATVDPALAEYEFTYEYLDYDGDGLISTMDTLVIDNLMPDVRVELYDTWADQYTSESFATAEMLPGFGALMAVVVLLGAAISTRRD